MLELIKTRVAGNGKDVVRLEKASAFYLPPICEMVKGSHAETTVKAELRAELSEDCLKLTNGSSLSPSGDSASHVAVTTGNHFKSYHSDFSNGTA